MDLKILSALIGLCGAVSNNGKTENTDRLVLDAILSKEPKDAVRRIHEEKYRISPDCASCPAPCGNTSDGDLSRWDEAPESVRKQKEEVMAALERMAFVMTEATAKAAGRKSLRKPGTDGPGCGIQSDFLAWLCVTQ